MDAAGQLAQLVEPAGELGLGRRQQLAGGRRVALEPGGHHAEAEGDGDQPLLGAVVQVALEPLALGVADLHQARPRGGQLLVRVGVGERLGDEVREVAQPLLDVLGKRLVGAGRRGQHAPQPPADVDRRGDGAAVAGARERRGELTGRLVVAVHARGVARADDPREHRVAVDVELRADREARLSVLAPRADDGGRAHPVVLHHVGAGQAEQAPHLLGHLLEHPAGPRVARHERGDPAQRGLLVGQLVLGRLGRRQRPGRAGALGGDGGEQQRRDRRDRDEELRREQAVGQRVAHERPRVLGRVPDRDRADDQDRRRRAARDRSAVPPTGARGRPRRGRRAGAAARRARPAPTSRTAASARSRRWRSRVPAEAHVRIAGATISTPAVSPSVHVRKTRPRSSSAITSPSHSEVGPKAALMTAATSAQAMKASTSRTRSRSPRPSVSRRSSSAATTSATRVPDGLRDDGAERRREVGQQQVADHDGRHHPRAPEEEDGQAHARRRPRRGHRAVEVGELQPHPPRHVVGERGQPDSDHVQGAAPTYAGDQRTAHGLRASLFAPSNPGEPGEIRSFVDDLLEAHGDWIPALEPGRVLSRDPR